MNNGINQTFYFETVVLRKLVYGFITVITLAFSSCNKESGKTYALNTDTENSGFAEELQQNKNISPADTMPLEATDLVTFIESPYNGYKKDKKIGEMIYMLQYKPHDYIAAIESSGQNITQNQKEEIISRIKDLDYFTFRIKSDKFNQELLRYNIKNQEEYYSRLRYYMNEAQNDIYLCTGKDSLPCVLFHFERTFGIDPYLTFSLGFERNDLVSGNRTFAFDDKIFGSGKINIQLSGNLFNNSPKLKTID